MENKFAYLKAFVLLLWYIRWISCCSNTHSPKLKGSHQQITPLSLSFLHSSFTILGIEPRALCMLGKCSATERHPQLCISNLYYTMIVVRWLLQVCSKCLLFPGTSKFAAYNWGMVFLWQKVKQGKFTEKMWCFKVFAWNWCSVFSAYISLTQTSPMAKPDNVAEIFTPSIESYYMMLKWAGMYDHLTGKKGNVGNIGTIHHVRMTC